MVDSRPASSTAWQLGTAYNFPIQAQIQKALKWIESKSVKNNAPLSKDALSKKEGVFMFDEYNNHDVAVYGGYLENNDELLKSASGGIATALAEYMIEQGGYVAGVAYSEDFYNAEYILFHDKSNIARLRGSKYIECDKKRIYADVKALVNAGEKVLFFGLPCTVTAMYKYIGNRPDSLITCELVCHGPTRAKVHKEYVESLEKKYKSKIIDFSVRYKKDEWLPAYLYAKFSNGSIFEEPFYDTEYGYAFSVLGKESCYHCAFKGNNRQGDIMVGDFWGADETDDFWNKYGVSSIFAETEKGNAFLLSTPGIKLYPTTFERAVQSNPMVIQSKTKSSDREKFSKLLSEKGLAYAAKHTPSVKSQLKRNIRQCIPKSIRPVAKKLYQSIKKK